MGYKSPFQRFFKQGIKSGWFEFGREEAVEREEEDVFSRVRKITVAGIERVQKKRREKIKVTDESKEPNLWLRRVGWVEHLEGKERPRLLASIQSVSKTVL
jgi:hypothetical protein